MRSRVFGSAIASFILLIPILVTAAETSPPAETAHLRNVGRAYYEEEKYEQALKAFQRCLSLAPDSAIDEINLGMVLVQLGRHDEARQHLVKGEKLDRSLAPYASYNSAIVYKREKRFAEAAKEFEKMRELDATCPDTAYNLAVVYESLGELEKAFGELSRAVKLAPDEIAPHYRRMMVAMRLGRKEIATAERKIFTQLRALDSRTRTPEELERSVYTEIVEVRPAPPAPPKPVVKNPLGVKFQDVTARVGLLTRNAAEFPTEHSLSWADIDGDVRPDLLVVKASPARSLQLWRNRGEAGFEEITADAGLSEAPEPPVMAAVFGDLDHDGDNDLCVSQQGGIRVFFNQGKGKFAASSDKPSVRLDGDARNLLLVDFDHDGDLDLYLMLRSGPPKMYRNDGKGGFTEVPDEAGLAGDGTPATASCFLDFDDDNDVDFFLSRPGRPNQLLSNMRMAKFQDVASVLGVSEPGNVRNLETADINNDGWPDIVLLLENGEVVALHGRRYGKFERSPLAKVASPSQALAVFDYDNDGDEDIFAAGKLLQNDGEFCDVSQEVGLAIEKPDELAQAAPEDCDGDGDIDLVLRWRDGRLSLLRNDGGNRNHWIRVALEGLQSNRFGVSTKVEIRDGTFFQRKICVGSPLLFGLGSRKTLDVLRLWWPTGVAQNILSLKVGETANVLEKLGPPSSCPFVYVWDGEKFSFLTDVLDATALGVPLGDGSFWPCRNNEDLLIPGARLSPKDGRLVILLTAELRELVYLDSARLTALAHPSDCEVYPDECAGLPDAGKSQLYCVRDFHQLIAARDDRGNDLRDVLLQADGHYAAAFSLTRFHGLAEKRTLLLDFGDISSVRRPVLVLNGWIEWIDGDTLYALGQGAGPAPVGPVLEMQAPDSRWERISENIGVPAGIGKNLVVELPRQFCGNSTRLRIITNLEVYWDRIGVGDAEGSPPLSTRTLELLAANLHFRGFSRIVRGAPGKPPWYDYNHVTTQAPWQPQKGLLTRYGDVLPVLSGADDRLVIFGPGDELTLTFTAPPELSSGHVRDYVLRLDGWIKDANPTTFTGDRVEPLPHRRMKSYPFGADETIPDDPSYAEYLSLYNTRPLRRDDAALQWKGIGER